MKISFAKGYNSIKQFNEVTLPNFVVLTGINGSGKSHLLEAIENKSILVDGQPNIKAVRFDYRDFFLDNEAAYNATQIAQERNNTWNFLQQNLKRQLESYRTNLGANYQALVDISTAKNKGFLQLSEQDIADQALSQQYNQYRQQVKNILEQHRNNSQALALKLIANKISVSLDEIQQNDFSDYFQPYQLKKDFLPQQLGRVIWDYFLRYRNNEVNEFVNEKYNKKYPVLSDEEFVRQYGNKPWEVINSILDNFHSVDYRLPSPDGSDYFGDYQVRLVHPRTKLEIDFGALSSGEKVLMALIASIYKISADDLFPDLLLLDEIDASLHPSMIKNLLETIDQIFLQRHTKVILVTHSPTTVALSPEESVYVMNKEGLNRVEKKSKNDALKILTEGFATLEEGLSIFDEISKQDISIISEGNNSGLIKKALELNDINDVEVVVGTEDKSGDKQLNTIFDFLSKIPHTKKVIVVWDPDVSNTLTEINHTYPLILHKNDSNKLADKGIENLFNEELFEDFTVTTQYPEGRTIKKFDGRKNEFASYVIGRNKKSDFLNFRALIDEIERVREASDGTE